MQRIEITASPDSGNRSVSNAELTKYGDLTIINALARVPGITVSLGADHTAEIKLRGLGSGYTRILLNGSTVPSGLSLESISPDMVERVEILTSPSVETGSQGISGTLNIILRKPQGSDLPRLKGTLGGYGGISSEVISGSYSTTNSLGLYSIHVNINERRDRWPSSSSVTSTNSETSLDFSRTTLREDQSRKSILSVVPGAKFRFGNSVSLDWDGLLQLEHFTFAGTTAQNDVAGVAPEFLHSALTFVNSSAIGRTSASIRAPFGERANINAKVGISVLSRTVDSNLNGYLDGARPILERRVNSSVSDSLYTSSGKYALSINNTSTIVLGWDGEASSRAESRLQMEASPDPDYALHVLNERYTASIARLAIYGQHEWQIDTAFSAYLGTRWECIRTKTRGAVDLNVSNTVGIISPVVRVTWEPLDKSYGTAIVSFGRSYKAPTARELIPRRWTTSDNTATSPDFQGNPQLVPEVSWGMDVSYERRVLSGGSFSASAYYRRISDVILPVILRDAGGLWLSTPSNTGAARVLGVEFELKFKMSAVVQNAPPIDLRLSLARNHSVLDRVPSPGNRLAAQSPLTATVGGDYRLAHLAIAFGGFMSYERRGLAKVSRQEASFQSDVRRWDIYGTLGNVKSGLLRMSITNISAPTEVQSTIYADSTLQETRVARTRSFPVFNVAFETEF